MFTPHPVTVHSTQQSCHTVAKRLTRAFLMLNFNLLPVWPWCSGTRRSMPCVSPPVQGTLCRGTHPMSGFFRCHTPCVNSIPGTLLKEVWNLLPNLFLCVRVCPACAMIIQTNNDDCQMVSVLDYLPHQGEGCACLRQHWQASPPRLLPLSTPCRSRLPSFPFLMQGLIDKMFLD